MTGKVIGCIGVVAAGGETGRLSTLRSNDQRKTGKSVTARRAGADPNRVATLI